MPPLNRKPKLRTLVLSFADPENWRDRAQQEKLTGEQWQTLRLKILTRDEFTCQYCGYKSAKYQIVHHIDGNPTNNDDANLTTICQMCNLIEHARQGCVVQKVVDLYKVSKHGQTEIIRITREMRDEGKDDGEIIKFLGLKRRAAFRMDKKYLSKLFGFVTSRASLVGDGMYYRWKAYHKMELTIRRRQDPNPI